MLWFRPVSCSTFALVVYASVLSAQSVAPAVRPLANAGSRDIAEGQKIFDAQCAWCHGANGTGSTGPNLQRTTLRHAANDTTLVQIVRTGIPGTEMPSFAIALTDRMAWQTAAYVRSLGRTRAQPLPGNAERGAALYDSSGCASCHIVNGRGGPLGPELSSIGALRGASYLKDALTKPETTHPPGYLVVRATTADGSTIRGVRVNEDVFWVLIRDGSGRVHSLEKSRLASLDRELQASLMPSYAARLSDGQVDDMVAYLSGLRGKP
jgi:putative heme-binding domain-containing protein